MIVRFWCAMLMSRSDSVPDCLTRLSGCTLLLLADLGFGDLLAYSVWVNLSAMALSSSHFVSVSA